MEPVVGELQGLNTGSSNLLGLPEPCPWDSDDELGIGGIKPKSSPIPRRRSSLSCSDDDSQPPPSSSRRVSFADAFGLSLVSVKQFKTWSMGDPVDTLEADLKDAKEYILKLHFTLPLTLEELLYRVQEQKVDLEYLELLPGTTTLKGTVRVLNLCFDKLVYIRTSLDCWSSHFDLLAEYMPESSNRVTDCFSFKLTLVPPFGAQGARVDFCIRYETPFGTFWANNNGQNYLLFCHETAKEQDENDKLKPKSCLKTSRHSSITSTTSDAEEIPEIILNCGIATVTEPVGVKGEKVQEKHTKLRQEENSRNCNRRSRRKVARMAKLQQYFAQRDEKDLQQTEKDTDKVDVLVPAIDEAPLNPSTPETNVASLMAEPRKTEGQKPIAGSVDADRNQTPALQTRTEERDNIPVIHPELITSESQLGRPPLDSANTHKSVVDSQLLESRQDKETITSQPVSPKCQTVDNSIGKTVERAWECFEKCAMERIGSTADNYSHVSKTNNVDNTLLKKNQGSQSFGQCYTFETIVAPLYHQVFERMENNRRVAKNSAPKADESVERLNGGRMREVTYPSVQTRSSPEISAKHVNDDDYHGACKETFPEYLHNTKSATEKALSVSNMKTKHVADIAFQDTALADVSDKLLEANISESKTAQSVTPVEKQLSSNSHQTIDQTPQMTILQSKHSDDTEYSLDNKPPYSVCSLNTLQHVAICIDSALLPTQSDVGTTATKHSPTIVSDNPQYKGSSVSQSSFETPVSNEIDKKQEEEAQTSVQTLNSGIRCLEKSCTPIPDSTLVHSDISLNVTPKSEASVPSQDWTQVTIRPQIPDAIFYTQSLEVTEATVSQLGTTDDTDLTQKTTSTCQNNDRSHHVGSETESNPSDGNVNVDSWKKIENDNETIQTEILLGPEDTDRISQTFRNVSQINENREHKILHLEFPDEVTDLNEILVKGTAMSNISSDPEDALKVAEEIEEDVKEIIQEKNPGKNEEQEVTENQSKNVKEITEAEKWLEEQEQLEEEEEEEEDVKENIQEKSSGQNEEQKLTDTTVYESEKVKEILEAETWLEEQEQLEEEEEEEEFNVKENIQEKNPGKNEEQEVTDMTENQSEKLKEITVVEKWLEEKEQDKTFELGKEDKFKDGSHATEDVKNVDDKEKDAEPRRNEVEWQNEKDLEGEIEEQEMVRGVAPVSTLPNNTNVDAFIEDVHLHLEQQQQDTSWFHMSEEAESEKHFIAEEKEILCGTDSSRQAVTLNSDVAFGGRTEEVENNSEFIDQEEDVCRQTDKQHVAEFALGEADELLEKQERVNEQSENVDDGTSTDSLTDDEMELYLLRLKNTPQSRLKDGMSMVKRHSVNRAWAIPSPMPSISEHLDEDQPNALLDDLTNEQIIELERATLPLLDKEEEVTEPNLLWWREFFSSDNMTKMIVYTLLFAFFVITTYVCDFMACFGLYLLALYWLYFQVQREPLKGT